MPSANFSASIGHTQEEFHSLSSGSSARGNLKSSSKHCKDCMYRSVKASEAQKGVATLGGIETEKETGRKRNGEWGRTCLV
jgi:hypothetical protein